MCQDLLLKGFTAVLNEQPLFALELAGCCKSLRDVCRPHLIFEDLSKLLLEKWAVPQLKWGIPCFCLVICPDSETRALLWSSKVIRESTCCVSKSHTQPDTLGCLV